MSVYNKIGGGVNKVLIDNKPPADRLNLTEVEVIIKGRAIIPSGNDSNFYVLSRKNGLYYIKINEKIYKGSPFTEWTEVISMSDIKSVTRNGDIYSFKINSDDSLEVITAIYDRYSTTTYFHILKIKNREITLIKENSIYGQIQSLFVLNNDIYMFLFGSKAYKITKNGEDITDIYKNINFDNGADSSFLGYIGQQSTFDNKRYAVATNVNPKKVVSFDGINFKMVKILYGYDSSFNFKSEQPYSPNSEDMLFSVTKENAKKDKYEFELLNKDFQKIISGDTRFNMDTFMLAKENNEYRYITREGNFRDFTLVEFPVKAYVRRE